MTPAAPNASESDLPVSHLLDAGLARLPDPQRQVVLLRYLEGLSLEETASNLDLSTAAVAKRAQRGLDALREFFGAQGYTVPTAAITAALAAQSAGVTQSQAALIAHAATEGTASPVAQAIAAASDAVFAGANVKLGVLAAVLLGAGVAGVGVVGLYSFYTSAPPARPPVVAALASAPASALNRSGEEAKALAESFLTALRNRDQATLVSLSPGTTEFERTARAAEFLANYRLTLYGRFPQRLTTGGTTTYSMSQSRQLTAATIDALSPTEADLGHLQLSLLASNGTWRIDAVTFDILESRYLGPAFDATSQPGASPVAALMSRMRSFQTVAPESATDADLPTLLAAYRQDLAEIAQVLALLPPDAASPRADLTVLRSALQSLVDAIEQGGLARLRATDEKLKSAPELKAIAGRYTAETDDAREIGPAVPRPPSFAPDLELKLDWSGETVAIQGPLKLPDWLTKTRAYAQWQSQHDSKIFRTRDDAGSIYEVSCNGHIKDDQGNSVPYIRAIHQYRPDGTLAAVAYFGIEGRPCRWGQVDATGRRYTVRTTVSYAQDPKSYSVLNIVFFDAQGNQRLWLPTDPNDMTSIRLDNLADPIGENQRAIHSTNGKGGVISEVPDPGIDHLPLRKLSLKP